MNIPPELEIFHMTLDLLPPARQPGPLQFEELPGPQPRPNGWCRWGETTIHDCHDHSGITFFQQLWREFWNYLLEGNIYLFSRLTNLLGGSPEDTKKTRTESNESWAHFCWIKQDWYSKLWYNYENNTSNVWKCWLRNLIRWSGSSMLRPFKAFSYIDFPWVIFLLYKTSKRNI